MKKLILDLRGNSGGIMEAAIQIANQFLKEDQLIVYTLGSMHSHGVKPEQQARENLRQEILLSLLMNGAHLPVKYLPVQFRIMTGEQLSADDHLEKVWFRNRYHLPTAQE